MKTRHRGILIREMLDADLPAVRSAACQDWIAEELPGLLANCLCRVVEDRGQFAGYAILELDGDRWRILAFHVLPIPREPEATDALWDWLLGLMRPDRPHLDCYVPAWAVEEGDALRALGFKAWRLSEDRQGFEMRRSLYLGGPVRPHGDIDEPHGFSGG